MMKLIAIVCADEKNGIGKNNDLLFSLPTDMKFFRQTTKGHTVIMGERTLASLPGGKPLKNRDNIVLSPSLKGEGFTVVSDLDALFALLNAREGDAYVMGGAMTYASLLPYTSEVLLTRVQADGEAEVFFPALDDFVLESESAPVTENGYTFTFCKYVRK